jgi:acetylglutamate kinase
LKLLVKLGGTLLDDEASRKTMASQLAALRREHELVVVHGGGKQVTRYLEERGIQSRFVGGLRVSDEAVIDAVTQVIAGKVNKQLVAAVSAAGKLAVGLSGVDGLLTKAERLNPDLGFVGKPTKTDGNLLDLLIGAGFLPIVACIAGDESGNIYNVNADQMAVSCATGWHATRLIFLTDVSGVKDGQGEIISLLTPKEVEALVHSGIAHGGMQAKLEAAVAGLRAGISNVTIASGHEPEICHRLLAGELLGTILSLNQAA